MKLTKTLLFIGFILLFLVTGCEGENSDSTNESKIIYDESEISISSDVDVLSIKKIESDLFIASYFDPVDHTYRLAYTDGQLKEIKPIENDLKQLIHVTDLLEMDNPYETDSIGGALIYDVDRDKNIYVLHFETVEKNDLPYPAGQKVIYVYDQEGLFQNKIAIQKPDQITEMRPSDLIVEGDRIFIVAESGIHIVSLEGETIDELAVASGKATDAIRREEKMITLGRMVDADTMSENKLVFIQEKQDGNFLTAYDISTQEIIWMAGLDEYFSPILVQYEPKHHQLLVASRSKIIAFDEHGTEAGELINLNEYAAGLYTTSIANDDEVLSPRSISVGLSDQMDIYMGPIRPGTKLDKIMSYRKLSGDEKAERIAAIEKEEQNKTTIDLFIPFVDATIEQKIAQYENANPNVNVNLSSYRNEAEEFHFEDFMQYVNLQLLSGKDQWDVLAVEMLPYREYSEKGYFADLDSTQLEQWSEEKEKYFSNILDGMKINDTFTILPARVAMQINLAEKEAAENLQPFQYTWGDLLQVADEFKTNDESSSLWAFTVSPYGAVMNSYQLDLMATEDDSDKQKQLLSEFLDTLKSISISRDQANSAQDQPTFIHSLFFPSQFPSYIDLIGEKKVLLPSPASPITGKHTFTLQEGYAINESSEVKEEALKFILYLSEHAEPVNMLFKQTFVELAELHGTTEERKEAIESLQAIVENLSALRDLDHRITDAISKTSEQYVMGVVDKESAIRTIQEKLWLYENE